MRTRLLAACVAVTAVLAGAVGCSSGSDGRSHAARASSDPASASAVPSASHRDDAQVSSLMRRLAAWSDTNHSVTATENAVFDGRKVRFDGLFAWGAQPAMDVRVPTAQLGLERFDSSDKTEVLLVGGSRYYRVDPTSDGPLKGRHWMRAPSSPSAGGSGAVAVHGLRPENSLRMLPDATGWTNLGTEDVDGTVGRHYEGTVTRAALAADSRLVRATGGSTSALLAGDDSAELDVWVDAHSNPVRFVELLGVGRSFAIDFYDFGGLKTVAPPAARDTADATSVPGRPKDL